jgi:hypothetical protein
MTAVKCGVIRLCMSKGQLPESNSLHVTADSSISPAVSNPTRYPASTGFRFIQTQLKMCHQLIQIFECGHNTGSKIVKCKNRTSECNETFLRQELEDTPRPCAVRYRFGNTWVMANPSSHVRRKRMTGKLTKRGGKLEKMKGIGLDIVGARRGWQELARMQSMIPFHLQHKPTLFICFTIFLVSYLCL